jgi:penicillin-binding protein 1C
VSRVRTTLLLAPLLATAVAQAAPDFATIRARHQGSEARLYDRHGELLHELRVDRQRRQLEWTALADISPALRTAVIRAEDQRFYDHGGVDWLAFASASVAQLFGNGARGASTLSMQLAARLDPTLQPAQARRDGWEKWRQIGAARELETRWNKAQIFEAYLNLVSFRGELQGITAAARGLFDKHPSGLDAVESALLAALIRAPNAAPESVATRACALADALHSTSCAAIRATTNQALRTPPRLRPAVADAPHLARRLLNTDTHRIDSTLDARLQRYARATLAHQLDVIGAQRVREGAVLVVENRTGEVLAYVGGRAPGYVDAVRAPRQAGSTLKPFLYQLALERRLLTAASILDDSPLSLAATSGLYVPQNYEHDFKGFVTARTSLAASLNIPAVRALTVVGADAFARRLRALGFRHITRDGDHYGFSLALGSAEVSLEQLVSAYRTLANGGWYSPLATVRGTAATRTRVLDSGAAFIVTDILADRAARGLTFGLENVLATPFWSAVKTGTSKDLRDNWCLGFTDRYTVGVWVGNFDGSPMQNVSGVTGAAPVWLEIMRYLHAHVPARAPRAPATVVQSEVSFAPTLENARHEYFLRGTEVTEQRLPEQPPLAQARIRYPARGSILALDPDIPDDAQRVFFEVSPRDAPLQLVLDGQRLSNDDGWTPRTGLHRLSLHDARGTVLDEVQFEVRGTAR